MGGDGQSKVESGDNAVAIYHIVYRHEGFDEAAQALFKLVQEAQCVQPDKTRKLFLDIEGHRNSQGGFDADMLELQKEFLVGVLAPFLSEIQCPLVRAKNPKPQNNDVAPELIIQDKRTDET